MKNIILITTLLLPVAGIAQSKIIDQLKDRFRDNQEVTSFSFSGNFLNMASWFDSDNAEDEAVRNLVKGIDRMHILSIPIGGSGLQEKEVKKLRKEISNDAFEDLMVIRDGDDEINIMVKEKDGIISHLLMVVNDQKDLTILDFSGKISMDDIAVLTDNVNFN